MQLESTMIRQMGSNSGAGQLWWELVDFVTGEVLIRSWEKKDIVEYQQKYHQKARPISEAG